MKRRKQLKSARNTSAGPLHERIAAEGGHAAPLVRPTETPTTRAMLLAAVVCGLLAVALVFVRTVAYDFVDYDDPSYVSNNPELAQGVSVAGIAWAFSATRCANWHPLTWLSLLADRQLFGADAWGFHLGNVALHAAAAILLFLVLWRMTGDMWPSAFVAAVFAIHPLRVESVAWVAERKDVLSGLLFMLTLGAYWGYVRRPFSLVRYLAVVVLDAFGLMARPMLVTLPFVLNLKDLITSP
jgi:protein O-mannosyl-transferase